MNRRARRAAAAQDSTCINFRTIITPPKVRRGLLLGASGLTLAIALGAANEAAALNECGIAAGVPPSVTCTPAGNPYTGGIFYDVDDLTIVVKSGVIINTTTKVGEPGGVVSGFTTPVGLGPGGSGVAEGDLVVRVSSGVSITTDDTYADGIAGGSGDGFSGIGSVSITSGATIKTSGDWASGISGTAYGGDVKVVASGNISTKGSIAGGIIVSSNLTTDHVLSIDSSAAITTSGTMSWGIRADSELNTNVDVIIKSSGKITTSGKYAEGIYGSSSTGASIDSDVTITSSSEIVTTGEQSHGIRGDTVASDSTIVISSTAKIRTTGKSSAGILAATHADNSPITVSSLGAVTTTGEDSFGILAGTLGDNSDVMVVSTAKVATAGDDAAAIFALSAGDDSDVNVVSTAAVTTGGHESHGIFTATGGEDSKTSIVSIGDITTINHEADGVHAQATGAGSPVTIVSTGNIVTGGGEADGIDADTAGDVTIVSTGKITTKGSESDGIEVESSAGDISAGSSGAIVTAGSDADGIHALADSGDVNITNAGTINTTGGGSNGSEGIWAKSPDGTITISNNSITTAGQFSDAIHADAGHAVSITTKNASASGLDSDGIDVTSHDLGKIGVTITGAVSGGWAKGQGVRLNVADTPTVTINAGGSLGALSDFVLQEGGQNLALTNKGTFTGFLDTGSGNDSINNAGTWELRNFADSNGDGVRDTESVAVADFGTGTDSFTNNGTLRLTNVTGASSVNTGGQIADPFGSDGDISFAGVEQGHLVNLEQFTNSGTITMQDGTVGDFLAITDQPSVGAGGGANFISNGGSLKLDVFLDDGSSGKTDMLFLDVATTGAGGATRVFVTNAGGAGALTPGDGIQIINVDGSSSKDAFTLGAPVVAGAFEYDLEFQNLAATDQSWYLRSHPFAAAAAYPAIASSALTTWRADLDSLEDRLSGLRLQMNAPSVTVPVTVAGIAEGGSMTVEPANFAGGWFNVTDSDDSVAQSGVAGFSQETARSQMGFDFALDNVSGHDDWLVVGAFGGQGWSEADFNDADSSADFDIAAMGVYASYFQGPYHLDALVKFDWLDGNYNSDAVSGGGDVTLPVFGVSLNTGYQFDLTHSETGGLSLQPLAALDYAHVGGDTFHDNSGAEIELMEMDSLRGRLGARLVQRLLPSEDGTGPVGNLYLSAGVAQELLGESEARVTGVTLTQ
ncbi:MAG TPA: autotransporter outer membrane beta-barrel domain-containing protein, partial [Dongiaceae bacterium]|nr:autotransporter outer membrane beta-barrel domain-containing protein [Dongiaceae bacterium]